MYNMYIYTYIYIHIYSNSKPSRGRSPEEAVQLANHTPYGLSALMWAESLGEPQNREPRNP